MMKADLAYKIRAKERNRWWLRLCARTRQEWLFRLLAPKPYRISGVYGAWHYADNAAKTPNENAQAQPPKETPERKGDL